MFALIAKDLHQEVGAAIDHLGLIGKVRRAVDHSQHFHNALHFAQVAGSGLERAEEIVGGLLGGCVALFDAVALPQLAVIYVRVGVAGAVGALS